MDLLVCDCCGLLFSWRLTWVAVCWCGCLSFFFCLVVVCRVFIVWWLVLYVVGVLACVGLVLLLFGCLICCLFGCCFGVCVLFGCLLSVRCCFGRVNAVCKFDFG